MNISAFPSKKYVVNLYVSQDENIYWDVRSLLIFLDKKFYMQKLTACIIVNKTMESRSQIRLWKLARNLWLYNIFRFISSSSQVFDGNEYMLNRRVQGGVVCKHLDSKTRDIKHKKCDKRKSLKAIRSRLINS